MRKPRLKEDDALAVVSVSDEQELKQKEREKKKGREGARDGSLSFQSQVC